MHIIDILKFLKKKNIRYSVDGDASLRIDGYSSIYNYKSNTISWLRRISTLEDNSFIMPESFTCLITQADSPRIDNLDCQIWVNNPKDTFFDVLEEFWGKKSEPVVSPQALIEEGAVIGNNVSIGPFSHISSETTIGDGTTIGSNVIIKGKVAIGKNCVIQSGAVLGEDGFAFITKGYEKKFVKHFGGVTLDDFVSIGSQTCVCRGAIDDTYIGKYSKIDNLCHIAHNVVIGERTVIVCHSVIMGSVHIGDDCWIATSMIRDQRTVGDNCVVGMGSVVVKDVPTGITVAGNPAQPFERKERI